MKKNHFADKSNKFIMSVDVMKSITDFSLIVEKELTTTKISEEDKKKILNIIENEIRRGTTKTNYEPEELLFLINIFASAKEISNKFDYLVVDYYELAKLCYSYELEKDKNNKHKLKKSTANSKINGDVYKKFDKLLASLKQKDVIRVMYDTSKETYEVCFEPAIMSFKIEFEGINKKKGTENILKDKTRRVYKILLHPDFAEQILKNYMLRSYNRTELIATLNQVPASIQRLILVTAGSSNTKLTYEEAYQVAYNKEKREQIQKSYVSKFKKACLEYKDVLNDWSIEATEKYLLKKISSKTSKIALFNPIKEIKKLKNPKS